MSLSHMKIAAVMTARELLRHRIVVLLFFIIPVVFLGLTVLTTRTLPLYFKLVAVKGAPLVEVTQRGAGIVFISLTTVALLAAFMSMYLMQKNTVAIRRLVLCGFSVSQMVLAKLAVMLGILVLVSGLMALLALLFLKPLHLALMLVSFLLIGYVYGSYGLLVGALIKRELEGILFVVLLVNIDIGWLQNPLYYEGAQNKLIIRVLPAFFPSQAGMIAAFSDYAVVAPLLKGALYGSVLLILALLIFRRRMKIYRND